jgi:hypothetical protein
MAKKSLGDNDGLFLREGLADGRRLSRASFMRKIAKTNAPQATRSQHVKSTAAL